MSLLLCTVQSADLVLMFQVNMMVTDTSAHHLLNRENIESEGKFAFTTDKDDIFEIEAIGPLIAVCTWPHIIQEALWMHSIDNNSALAVMVRGSGSIHSADVIAGMVWSRVAHRCRPWLERVESTANPVDGLSRGKLKGPWDLIDLILPADLHEKLHNSGII